MYSMRKIRDLVDKEYGLFKRDVTRTDIAQMDPGHISGVGDDKVEDPPEHNIPVADDREVSPTSAELAYQDNEHVLRCLQEYAALGGGVFWGHLAQACEQHDPNESKARKRERAYVIEHVQNCMTEYDILHQDLHTCISSIQADRSHAQREWAQQCYGGLLLKGQWVQNYMFDMMNGISFINDVNATESTFVHPDICDELVEKNLAICYIPTESSRSTDIETLISGQIERMKTI
jgi:hypothetical protein